MHPVHATTDKYRRQNKSIYSQILISIVSIIVTTSCSSLCHKNESLGNVVDNETRLLESLKKERLDGEVVQKVRKDPTLWNAERHLMDAIRALTEATDAVKAAL